jgi:hypothetical protein
LIKTITAVAALCALPSLAEARARMPAYAPECNVTMPCEGVGRGGASLSEQSGSRPAYQALTRAARDTVADIPMAGLVAPLAAKLASIEAACPGTHAISTVRHTRIAGTRRMSLHAQGKAVDVRGPYGCIYGQLRDWNGGYSTDAGRVQHIHISYDDAGGREMGLRFAHGSGRRHAWRNSFARMR